MQNVNVLHKVLMHTITAPEIKLGSHMRNCI